MAIRLTSGALATLLAEATRAAPREACGLLLGRSEIAVAAPCANVHAEPLRHFEIDPAALIAAHRAARAGGAEVLGYYHSHPNGVGGPSDQDRSFASGDGRVWAIIARDAVTWWRDGEGGFERLSLRLVEG